MYDTKILHCVECDETMGEIDFDAEVMQPKCAKCVILMRKIRDNLMEKITANNKMKEPITA